jgi:polar amino acid transport system substrate-binding protein
MRRLARVAFFWFAALAARGADYTLLTLQYPPYAYESEPSEEAQGLAVDMVREVFSRLGHTVRIQLLPWPRVLWMIEHGEADGFFTTYRLPEREAWADYCREELAPQVVSLYALKSAPVSYSGDLAGLSDRIIGVVTKVSYGKRFDRAVQDGVLPRVVASLDGERNFRQLFAGRVELVASSCVQIFL